MSSSNTPDDNGDERLARSFATLGSPLRLAVLRQLRAPKTLREIHVRGYRAGSASTLSRQAVREHLDRLLEAGILIERETEKAEGATHEFTLNHQVVFALSEEVKELARLRPLIEPNSPTSAIIGSGSPTGNGPRLVIVKGLEEGTTFPLDGRHEWVIGRRRGSGITLDFDPFVSSENALLKIDGGRATIEDLPVSKNGTRHNFRSLRRAEIQPLSHGDLIGVGRTLLLYWS